MMKKDTILKLQALLSLPNTIIFNFKYLDFKTALKLPFLVHYRTKIIECHKGSFEIKAPIQRFMIKIGFGFNQSILHKQINVIWMQGGKIIFQGKAIFGEGVSLRCGEKATIELGNDFSAMQGCVLWSRNTIKIGANALLGWNVFIRDHDGHTVLYNGIRKPENKPILIGDHVWICSESHILKGAEIQNDCIIGYKSLVTKMFHESNVIIAGHPAKIVQENINWER